MARTQEHEEKINAAAQARHAAVDRLIALHREEFNRIYTEERVMRGLSPVPSGKNNGKDTKKIQAANAAMAAKLQEMGIDVTDVIDKAA